MRHDPGWHACHAPVKLVDEVEEAEILLFGLEKVVHHVRHVGHPRRLFDLPCMSSSGIIVGNDKTSSGITGFRGEVSVNCLLIHAPASLCLRFLAQVVLACTTLNNASLRNTAEIMFRFLKRKLRRLELFKPATVPIHTYVELLEV